jgi:hypothetical protein
MGDRPTAADLVETARRLLGDDDLDDLPDERRYDALMIANAMAIAGRMEQMDGGEMAKERDRLAQLLEVSGDRESLIRELAKRIRSGAYDPGSGLYMQVWECLHTITLRRVGESNPRALRPG